ncbi:histidine phosphatase family protein [Streptomyces sp. NBC_00390]|uniref:histidine phosphatase family protein n=1 Tax=Streptomyces sp. NBC_00390 TaxID=2975736 RepID=UPI002E212D73
MTVRVTLISPAMSVALRDARFDDGLPLDPAGFASLERAERMSGRAHVSDSARCHATAKGLGLDAEALPALAGCAMGRWRGLRLDEVAAADQAAVTSWLTDPGSAPHGGESLRDLRIRVGAWLDASADRDGDGGRLLCVVEPDVVRAALVHALSAPDSAFWRLDVRPLTATGLSGRAGRWNVQAGRSLVAPGG